jgi:hypothetical protein
MTKYVLLLAAAFSIYACAEKQPTEAEAPLDTELVTSPATATGDPETAPIMTFEKDVHDFGKIIQGEKVSYILQI